MDKKTKKIIIYISAALFAVFVALLIRADGHISCIFGHDWREATCDFSERCMKCSMVRKDKLGHTTNLGYCTRCNKYQNTLEDEWLTIDAKIYSVANGTYISLCDQLIKAQKSYNKNDIYFASHEVKDAEFLVKQLGRELDHIYCGHYEEFKDIQKHIDNAKSICKEYNLALDTYNDGVKTKEVLDNLISIRETLEFEISCAREESKKYNKYIN